MKFLAIFALVLVTVCAFEVPKDQLRPRSIVLPVGHPEGRVTHGQNSKPGQFPYQVGIRLKDNANVDGWCGGSLISQTKVLTAAHCVSGIKTAQVYLGSTIREHAEVTYKIDSRNFIIHPGWNNRTLANDIAMINIPLTYYSSRIQPVRLPSIGTYSTYYGDVAFVSGWGHVSDYLPYLVTNLQFAHMFVVPIDICKTYYSSAVRSSNLCLTSYSISSVCGGDSGGPLVSATTKTQIGLTSFGHRSGCEKGYPTVFTALGSYLNWIKDKGGVSY